MKLLTRIKISTAQKARLKEQARQKEVHRLMMNKHALASHPKTKFSLFLNDLGKIWDNIITNYGKNRR